MNSREQNDRELLELAAKAAGYKWDEGVAEIRKDSGLIGLWLLREDGSLITTSWNPLNNDGDVLRLACKLEMQVDTMGGLIICVSAMQIRPNIIMERVRKRDICEVTRIAITRAAAEIGSKIP